MDINGSQVICCFVRAWTENAFELSQFGSATFQLFSSTSDSKQSRYRKNICFVLVSNSRRPFTTFDSVEPYLLIKSPLQQMVPTQHTRAFENNRIFAKLFLIFIVRLGSAVCSCIKLRSEPNFFPNWFSPKKKRELAKKKFFKINYTTQNNS